MKKKRLFPLNIQLHAEGGGSVEGGEGGNQPTYEELVTQLATERAEHTRTKNQLNKASSEAAGLKRQLRDKMTAEEQEAEARKEQEEKRQKEFDDMKRELAVIRATKRYLQLGMDETLAEETATAEIEGDMEQVTLNYKKHSEALTKAAYQKFLKERPEINAGNGDTKNSFANERARLAAKRFGSTADSNILAHYGIGGKR